MGKVRIKILVLMVVMVIVSIACGFSASTANIKDSYLAKDEAGKEKTTVYPQDSVFYCIVTLANAPNDTTLKAVWTAVDAKDTAPNFKIDEVSTTTGDGTVPFTLTNDNLWPVGKYKVDLYLNDVLKQTLNFEVQ
jgi:ABC-type Fe3+-citrate transport system substrate-binding protein